MPNGCSLKDRTKCKCNAELIEWPKPQPGQLLMPNQRKKHKEGAPASFSIKKRKTRADIQTNNSRWQDKSLATFLKQVEILFISIGGMLVWLSNILKTDNEPMFLPGVPGYNKVLLIEN